MSRLFTPCSIRHLTLANRICVPPMVVRSYSDESGFVSDKNVSHYRQIAAGEPGLIIVEATCVSPDGKLAKDQLGLWEDAQIEGHRRITDVIHQAGIPVFLQLHHAGIMNPEASLRVCPSTYSFTEQGISREGTELTASQADHIADQFLAAAKRAYAAGYDGIELHGCHKYLMCQFFNRKVNRRTDQYGPSEAFAVKVLDSIREALPSDYIVGIRLGGFEPGLEDGIRHAQIMEAHGADFLDISYGFDPEQESFVPDGYPCKDIHYAAAKIKEAVSVPVMAVNGISSREMADLVLDTTGVDMVDIARGILVNPNWPRDAREGRPVGRCLTCPSCKWRSHPDECAGRRLLARQRAERAGNPD